MNKEPEKEREKEGGKKRQIERNGEKERERLWTRWREEVEGGESEREKERIRAQYNTRRMHIRQSCVHVWICVRKKMRDYAHSRMIA